MSNKTVEKVVDIVEFVDDKPYIFRTLGAQDVFLMVRILNKIGFRQVKECLSADNIQALINAAVSGSDTQDAQKDAQDAQKDAQDAQKDAQDAAQETQGAQADQESVLASVGVGVAIDAFGLLLENLPKCEADIYQLLAQTSNLSVDTIKAPGNAVMFMEMIVDFLHKKEFGDFFKVAKKLLK